MVPTQSHESACGAVSMLEWCVLLRSERQWIVKLYCISPKHSVFRIEFLTLFERVFGVYVWKWFAIYQRNHTGTLNRRTI